MRRPARRRRALIPVLPLAVAGLSVILATSPTPASAQWISPGELSEAHAELDGDRNCTACHVLRERGVQARLCLDCHAPLARRVAAGLGFHANPGRDDCGECHREHFGREVHPVRFDTAAFRHDDETGWALRGSHDGVACSLCHRADLTVDSALAGFEGRPGFRDRTYLALPTVCAACHAPDDPHGTQFAEQSCSDCHDEVDWERPVLFSHDRTAYVLTGLHRDVACEGCHVTEGSIVRYVPLDFGTCASCHADPHGAAMSGSCSSCHTTAGWGGVDDAVLASRFRHAATRFPLQGAHDGLECESCHNPAGRRTASLAIRIRPDTRDRAFPLPTGVACARCHVDTHQGELATSPGGGACDVCHGSAAWLPTDYDVARHNRLAAFPLSGAHAATPCGGCHRSDAALTLKLGSTTCRSCHAADDPHEGRFGDQTCDTCHGTGSFRVPAFEHETLEAGGCADCHAADDPHGDQFAGRECDACHSTESYAIPDYPHEETGFALDGAHARAPCAACHTPEPASGPDSGADAEIVRWVGISRECADCHGGMP